MLICGSFLKRNSTIILEMKNPPKPYKKGSNHYRCKWTNLRDADRITGYRWDYFLQPISAHYPLSLLYRAKTGTANFHSLLFGNRPIQFRRLFDGWGG